MVPKSLLPGNIRLSLGASRSFCQGWRCYTRVGEIEEVVVEGITASIVLKDLTSIFHGLVVR